MQSLIEEWHSDIIPLCIVCHMMELHMQNPRIKYTKQ